MFLLLHKFNLLNFLNETSYQAVFLVTRCCEHNIVNLSPTYEEVMNFDTFGSYTYKLYLQGSLHYKLYNNHSRYWGGGIMSSFHEIQTIFRPFVKFLQRFFYLSFLFLFLALHSTIQQQREISKVVFLWNCFVYLKPCSFYRLEELLNTLIIDRNWQSTSRNVFAQDSNQLINDVNDKAVTSAKKFNLEVKHSITLSVN